MSTTPTRRRTAGASSRHLSSGGRSPSRRSPGGPTLPTLSFSRVNAIWLGAGAAAIGIGYALLAGGSMTAAPVLLVLGYCVLLPIGIVKK